MNNFVVEKFGKSLIGYRYLNSYKLSVLFKPNNKNGEKINEQFCCENLEKV
jgi:hypothetical protein